MSNLREWYQQINEEDILPNGIIKLKVPVLDQPEEEPEVSSITTIEKTTIEKEIVDPVVEKDKMNSEQAFLLNKRMHEKFVDLCKIQDPYAEQSEERNSIVSSLKEMHIRMGEYLSCL